MSIEEYLDSLRGRTVAVIGVGVSNQPLIELLLSHGVSVTARDRKEDLGPAGEHLAALGARLRLGEDYLGDLREDVIFRTPGMRPDLPALSAAVAAGSRLTSEMEVFLEVCAEKGISPKKQAGRFALRLDSETYQSVAIAASASGKSINQFIVDSLKQSVQAV